MTLRRSYPPDLARHVCDNWPEGLTLALSHEHLLEALSVAFQASLTSEESRPTRFRLLLTPAERLPEAGEPNEGVLRLRFDQSRPFTASELRSLAPASPFEASLIAAHVEADKLRIWGLAHSGPAWLAPSWGGRGVVPNWTYDPIVHVTGPGRLAVRCAGKLIGALERGVLVDAMMDVYDSKWLAALFASEWTRVQAKHAARQAGSDSPTAVEESLVKRVGQHMLRRAIQLIRGARHGGLILVVDAASAATPAPLSGLRLKNRFDASEPPRRYRTLLFRLLDRMAAGTTSASVDWADFERDTNPDLEKLEQAIFEMSRIIAGLASVDGAVVIDKRFSLIAFGAEVSEELPAPQRVFSALDSEGTERVPAALEDVGTRHRAAYRFVHGHHNGLAIVISQDGGVSFVAKHDGDIVSFEQSVSP